MIRKRPVNITASLAALALSACGVGAPSLEKTTSNAQNSSCRMDNCEVDIGSGREVADPGDGPVPTPVPPYVSGIPGCNVRWPGFPSSRPYATDQAAWLRQANRFGWSEAETTAFINFHHAPAGSVGLVYGTYTLDRMAIAAWRDVPRADLGWPALEDVPAMVRSAQAFARRMGYQAAIPTFEQADYGQGPVFGIHILATAAVEVVEVDICEVGYVDDDDVSGMFRAASDFAVRRGYDAGYPTFQRRYRPEGGINRAFDTIILFRSGYTHWRDVPDTSINPECGREGLTTCDGARCEPGLEAHWSPFTYTCRSPTPPPPCGGKRQECCSSNPRCEDGLACRSQGLFRPSICDVPPQPPTCGDGICSVLTSNETCSCEDCAGTWACRGCPDGRPSQEYEFCTVCPGDYVYGVTQSACDYDGARAAVQNAYANCQVSDGRCH